MRAAWGLDTATTWRADDPALGQCGVTALVVHDALGGDILKTPVGDAWHFYNRIGGERADFTASQFDRPPTYEDVPSSRDEALLDTSPGQYAALRARAGLG